MQKRVLLGAMAALLFVLVAPSAHAATIAAQAIDTAQASSTNPYFQTYTYYLGTGPNFKGDLQDLKLRFDGKGNNWVAIVYCRTTSSLASSNCGNFGNTNGVIMNAGLAASSDGIADYTASWSGANTFSPSKHYFFQLAFDPEPLGPAADFVNFPTIVGAADPSANPVGGCVSSQSTEGFCILVPDIYFELIGKDVIPDVTVNNLLTKNTRPTISGTTLGVSVGVGVNNKHYQATPVSGNWSVTLPAGDDLTDGSYVVTASSTDIFGILSEETTGTVDVDTIAPAIAITSGPADDGFASTSLVTLALDVTDVHPEDSQCSFDDTASTTCATSASATLAEGNHKFAVGATDKVGNASYHAKHFAVDTTAPSVTVDSRLTNELAPVITGTHSDNLSGVQTVRVVVNGTTYNASVFSSTWSVTLPSGSLSEGSYSVSATATDRAGNTASGSGTLSIDRTPPVVTITSGFANGALTNMTSATFGFTSDAPTVCSIDGGTLTICSGSFTVTGLSSGTHLFTVSATDDANNTTTRTRSWSVDNAAPILAEVAIDTTTTDTTPDYKFSSTKAGTITYGGSCSSATTAAVVGDNTVTFNTLAVGTYSNCTVTVTDALGNPSAVLHVSTFTISPVVQPSKGPTDKEQCKNGGWRNFDNPIFKNQGDCVSYVVSNSAVNKAK